MYNLNVDACVKFYMASEKHVWQVHKTSQRKGSNREGEGNSLEYVGPPHSAITFLIRVNTIPFRCCKK